MKFVNSAAVMMLKSCIVILFCLPNSLAALREWQPVLGAIYHPKDESLFTAFKQSIDRLNKQNFLSQQLMMVSFKTHSNKILSYESTKKLRFSTCIFDLSFNNEKTYALAELLRTPMITLESIKTNIRNEYIFSLRPSDEAMALAAVDLINYFFKNNNMVAILGEVKRSHLASRIFSIARYRNRVRPIMIPHVNADNGRETQRGLTVLLRSSIKYVVVVADPRDTSKILEKAMRSGCVYSDSKWIVVDMELTGNISALAYRGLVGLRLFYDYQHKLKRDAEKQTRSGRSKRISMASYAVLNDSIHAASEAIRQMKQIPYDSRGKDDCPIKDTAISEDRGQSLFINNLMMVRFEGLTGPVIFNARSRYREVQLIDIINVQVKSEVPSSFMYPIGYWKANKNTVVGSVVLKESDVVFWNGYYWEEIRCDFRSLAVRQEINRRHRPLVITTILDSPYMMLKKNSSNLKGNDRFEGFGADLIKLVADKLMFKYQIVVSRETSYGSPVGGEWKGLVRELIDQEADVAVGPITITAEREEVIDFSKPFLDFRIAMILTKPTEEEVNLFAFLLPFEEQLWLCVCGVVGTVTIIMWILDRFSPYGYRADAKNTGDGDGDEFSLSNSLWFATGSILQQGADTTPRSGSGRVLAAAFWLFTLILISTYTANLAAYFTAKNTKSSINSLEDLIGQDRVRFGVLKGGSLYTFFENSKARTYKKMFGMMKTLDTFVNTTKYGVQLAREGNFAYLTDQPSLDYYNQRKPCSTMLVKNLLDAKSYAFGLQKNSEWTNEFSVTLLELREEGEVEKLRLRWWDDRSECPTETTTSSQPTRLALHHLAGVFIILGGGAAISLALLLVENRCRDVIGSGGTQAAASSRDDIDGRPRNPATVTANGGTAMKPLNNNERRSPRPPGFDIRIPNAYATAPESNL